MSSVARLCCVLQRRVNHRLATTKPGDHFVSHAAPSFIALNRQGGKWVPTHKLTHAAAAAAGPLLLLLRPPGPHPNTRAVKKPAAATRHHRCCSDQREGIRPDATLRMFQRTSSHTYNTSKLLACAMRQDTTSHDRPTHDAPQLWGSEAALTLLLLLLHSGTAAKKTIAPQCRC